MSEKSLAERCYAEEQASDELFNTIHSILGGGPIEKCTEEGFHWPCVDTWVDPYDASVEVILGPGQPPMTREQADQILALGFGQIYESPEGRNWSKGSTYECSARETRSREPLSICALRTKLADAQKLIALLTAHSTHP